MMYSYFISYVYTTTTSVGYDYGNSTFNTDSKIDKISDYREVESSTRNSVEIDLQRTEHTLVDFIVLNYVYIGCFQSE